MKMRKRVSGFRFRLVHCLFSFRLLLRLRLFLRCFGDLFLGLSFDFLCSVMVRPEHRISERHVSIFARRRSSSSACRAVCGVCLRVGQCVTYFCPCLRMRGIVHCDVGRLLWSSLPPRCKASPTRSTARHNAFEFDLHIYVDRIPDLRDVILRRFPRGAPSGDLISCLLGFAGSVAPMCRAPMGPCGAARRGEGRVVS